MKRLAVLGQPISHSRSPAIHNAALAELGLSGEWSYEAFEVSPEEFEQRIGAMPGQGFVGANVTVPHKLAALELADHASETARAIGAANTLSFREGRVVAENTDATGFLEALSDPPRSKRALVLGAGGSSRAVVWALVTSGAEVRIWNRTTEKAERLASEFGASAAEAIAELGGFAPSEPSAPSQASGDFDLLVNATTVGMSTEGPPAEPGADLMALHLDADSFGERHQVVDLAYGPAETELARVARAHGATVVDGLEVLVRHGAASLRIWTGMDPPIEVMRRAARAQLPG
jgi:shikimate dehydrogenase